MPASIYIVIGYDRRKVKLPYADPQSRFLHNRRQISGIFGGAFIKVLHWKIMTLRSVKRHPYQRYRCRLYLSAILILRLAGHPKTSSRQRSVSLSNCLPVLLFTAFKPILPIKHVPLKIKRRLIHLRPGGIATLWCPKSRACFTGNSSANLERFSEKCQGNMK